MEVHSYYVVADQKFFFVRRNICKLTFTIYREYYIMYAYLLKKLSRYFTGHCNENTHCTISSDVLSYYPKPEPEGIQSFGSYLSIEKKTSNLPNLFGKTWTKITKALPEIPTLQISIIPKSTRSPINSFCHNFEKKARKKTHNLFSR